MSATLAGIGLRRYRLSITHLSTALVSGLDQLKGSLADRYRIERELGRGGMATVYLAQDLRHDRPVALKVLHPELAHTLGPERFLREIKLTARLDHPHILPVLDSGDAAGLLWYTMPYVEGESLRDRLRREVQLPVDEAVRITREVADALDCAHEHGIIHRDIKPENILLSRGHARAADFGVARALEAAGGDQLTETGLAVGTPQYMAPEQASGGTVDPRTDVYALGCVLYELLTGEPPYTGPTPQAITIKRFTDPVPPVRRLRPAVPEAGEQALAKALAPVPADRFSTAAEFARALTAPEVNTPAPSPVPQAPSIRRRSRRHLPVAVATLALGFLLGLGALWMWRRSSYRVAEAGGAGPTRLAVLPFENLGDSAQAYFADGVTDAVRDKLAALPGLEVIASTSSNQYRHTAKRPEQIGRELGVRYLLVGRVRWAMAAGGASRVQVRPELVDASSGAERWGEPFDAPLTDVFQVQADIAHQVAEALGMALGRREREQLAEKPTQNLAAYEAYLRGEQRAQALGSTFALAAHRRVIDYYEGAVALDSSFALAWAQLSRAYSRLYWLTPTPATATAAREAAERALALAPKRPEGYLALSDYYGAVRHDFARAFEQSRRGQQLAPRDARLLGAVGWGELILGRPEEALANLREAQVLDPRSVEAATSVVQALTWLRRYPEALAAAQRALALAPSNLQTIHATVKAHLGRGDLAGARAVLRAVPREVDPAALVAYIANWDDLYWVLEDAQQRLLLRLSPAPFGDDRAVWSFALSETYALRGDSGRARVYADSARLAYEARLRDVPEDAGTHAYLGLALAYLARKAEAIREGERAVGLVPMSRHPGLGTALQHHLSRIYVLVGEPEKALDRLEPLLKLPYFLSPGWLKIDPTFAPLRGNPRFERLVNGS